MDFTLDYTPNNNHGCSGFSITVRALSDKEGQVISGSSCSSCWQVGHDDSRSPIPEDEFVRLPEGWTWEGAVEEDKEFVRTDISLADGTKVRPEDLIVIDKQDLQSPEARIKALRDETGELKKKITQRNRQIRDLRKSLTARK